MIILALEFSSPQRSVAIARGKIILAETFETGGRNTAAFGMIEKVLGEGKITREEIELIVVGLGPGSYTGIRAAISIAQGWQLAREIKLLGVSSVAAIATQAQAEKVFGRVNVLIDAQRNEFYFAGYEISENNLKEVEPLKILPLAEIKSRENETARGGACPTVFVGAEMEKWFQNGRTIFPRAAELAKLAAERDDFLAGEKLEPVYLRETNFVKLSCPKSTVDGMAGVSK